MREGALLHHKAPMRMAEEKYADQIERCKKPVQLLAEAFDTVTQRMPRQSIGRSGSDRFEIDHSKVLLEERHPEIAPGRTGTTGVGDADRTATGYEICLS
jgi:hypothetical protein